MLDQTKSATTAPLDVLVIGTGFSGLCMAIKLKEDGVRNFLVLEKSDEVGGTWRDNTYPGCACDVPSHLYSFSFEPKPDWSRMFAQQPEIFSYLRHCANKYGLRPYIRFGKQVVKAAYDDDSELWHLTTADGEVFSARTVVSGMGALHVPAYTSAPGRERFAGKSFHSAQWDHDYDLSGKRVAVIGTGASSIQFVPQIAGKVASLTLFQRTPPWIMPKPDRRISEREQARFRRWPILQRLRRSALYVELESRVLGFTISPKLMTLVEKIARAHIRRQIADPVLRDKVTPDYTIGCKRVLISNDYYPALTRDNVDVITGGIREITERGVVDAQGVEHEVDTIIYGTGFRVQELVERGTIVGRQGLDIVDAWPEGPEAFLGINVAGFPNFHFLLGPNTGLGHNSMVYMIESQVQYVRDALKKMRKQKLRSIEVRPEAQREFNANIHEQLSGAVWSSGCKSWYINEHGRNTTLWPGFTFRYRKRTRHIDLGKYQLEPIALSESNTKPSKAVA
ncbi:MAG: NAD(P)/FAD-dependent oxidoreductase [Gammaproteobacteria bacterium]|nr:NAD(P)/FAD-dependent oxidoreductase [Gammaproteobacteria bacterium]